VRRWLALRTALTATDLRAGQLSEGAEKTRAKYPEIRTSLLVSTLQHGKMRCSCSLSEGDAMRIPLLLSATLAATLVFGASVDGRADTPQAYRDRHDDRRHDRASVVEVGYDRGYRDGLKHGEKDGRKGRDFVYAHHKDYEKADRGYRKEFGSRERYRRIYRDGYVDGYTQGYYRETRGGRDGRREPRAVPRRNRTPGRDWPPWGDERVDSAPFTRGYADGYEAGDDAGRDDKRYDPTRHGRYRSADRGYEGRYGSRDRYKDAYREGFLAGYDEGFEDGRWSDNDGRRGSPGRARGWPWPF